MESLALQSGGFGDAAEWSLVQRHDSRVKGLQYITGNHNRVRNKPTAMTRMCCRTRRKYCNTYLMSLYRSCKLSLINSKDHRNPDLGHKVKAPQKAFAKFRTLKAMFTCYSMSINTVACLYVCLSQMLSQIS